MTQNKKIMKKETYQEKRTELKKSITDLTIELDKLRIDFIELNKPCNIDDAIEVVTAGDRKIRGVAKSFSINSKHDVFVSAIKPSKGAIVYLSMAHKSIKLI